MPRARSYTLENPPPGTAPYITLRHQSGTLICRYRMQKNEASPQPNNWHTHLPLSYLQALESGHWQFDITFYAEGQVLEGEGSIDPELLGFQPQIPTLKG